ncbi:NACHT, LRR and PYD domains-containing protein 12-like [Pocillopora verrucosa]|uniref:NACHT, LRR and PYD domains-containing protein 12-like n=1 Tax=Pocillopora verrucosa TaxID=203993 RepID=UPI00333E48A1
METVKEYFLVKYFSCVGYFGAVFHLLALFSLLAATAALRINERLRFSCQSATHLRDYCLVRYDKHYTPLPLYGFVLLCFVPLVLMCITYSWCFVKSRVDELETALKADPENPRRRPRVASRRVFRCYFIHLLLRCLWGILCAALQKCVFYLAGFPAEFACVSPTVKPTVNSTNSNATKDYSSVMINCDNSVASDKNWNATLILVVNVVLALLVFGEMLYLLVQKSRSKEFTLDSEFCQKHFWNKKTLSVTLRHAIAHMREKILRETETIEPLIAESDGNLKLDDNFVNLVIYTGRAEHEFTNLSVRHEIFDVYLKPKHGLVAINSIKELFLQNKDTQNPFKILVIGRPGIGKSLLCTKISRDWGKDELLPYFHLFYLIRFRWFNDETLQKISLKELLCRLHPEGSNDDELFQYVLDNPEKVIIVFDGLDEFNNHLHCLKDDEAYGGNNAKEQMPLSALYVKLLKEKLLPGATILTTSRPDAVQSIAHLTALHINRKVEIMGFTSEKIKEYVEKHFDEGKVDRIWSHLSSNLELLSLCYIPVNARIICSLLETRLKLQEDDPIPKPLPSTSTEVYKEAVRLFIFKHHPEFQGKTLTQDFLVGNDDFPDTVNRAGALAKKGIEDGQLVFDSHEVQGMENCGLFNRMPNRKVSSSKFESQYCFLHLIFQEFLAAWEIAKMKPDELTSFVRTNALDPKWHLVLQFVAGLLGDVKNEAVRVFVHMLCEFINKSGYEEQSRQMALLMMKCLHEYNDEDTVKQAASEIQSSTTFYGRISIKLCFLQFNDLDCAAIVYLIKHLHGNIMLNLCSNLITDEGVPYLCTALKDEHCNLAELDLSDNKISEQGVSHLCAALKDEHCKLTTLNISYNKISEQGVSHLCAALKDEHCKLTMLDLCSNNTSDKGASHLCAALKDEHCKLTMLDLRSNNISDKGTSDLCAALKDEHCKLTKLGLSSNNISDKGASDLCAALKDEHCKLAKLDLSSNNISDKGASDLCAALKDEHCKLTMLDLRSNNILDKGASDLCAALKDGHCKLTYLSLPFHEISDKGV